MPTDAPLTFDATVAVIRLAHKYDLPAVRNQALSVLRKHTFPSRGPRPWRTYPNPTVRVRDIHAIGAVSIARLLDKPALLYPALYRCAVLGSAVLDGWTRDDGTVEHLTLADLRICMDAQAALARESAAIFAATFMDVLHKDCESTKECRAGLRKLEDAMLLEEFGKRHDVLDTESGEKDIEERATALGVCKHCRTMLERRRKEKQREVWKRLPELFGIEDERWASDTDADSDADEDVD